MPRLAIALAALCALIATTLPAPAEAETPSVRKARFDDRDPVDFGRNGPRKHPVHGIDVARFQGDINWRKARRDGVNFAFIKATEGGDLLDPIFKTNWQGAARAGVLRGAYHFYYFCTSASKQAKWFIRNVPRVKGALPPVLDMEWNPFSPTCKKRPPASEVRQSMRTFLNRVERHFGQRPIIYTTRNSIAKTGWTGCRAKSSGCARWPRPRIRFTPAKAISSGNIAGPALLTGSRAMWT